MRASFRITFGDFIEDPDDDDCRRRAATIHADRITFESAHLILWVGDRERASFAMEAVQSVEVTHVSGSSRHESPDQTRTRYPNVGKLWSKADDKKLLALYRAGQKDYEVLADQFGRKPGAIRSRLGRLGLEQL
ncbi:hypothetical protein OH733_17975 [Streptomyces griseus]|uniref:hypothetical protein n=1 Tax=Streptomyces griseus TaxID=1911 RepID=UPI003866F9F1|nr:hypothetical protein OH733_17975 [Streptomyces griseus]WTD68860.1 hypothetical protein OH763_19015 [Streptomyces griseus]